MYYINVFKNGSLVAASGFINEQDALAELARFERPERKEYVAVLETPDQEKK
jgi:hypothetical protein